MGQAVIYSRVSTDEQAKDSRHSLPAQSRVCTQAAKELGLRVVASFQDPGRSATTMNRPGLKDALLFCQENPVDAFIVQETDRLARNTEDHFTIRAILEKAEVRLVSAAQPMLETSSAEGKLIDTILASINAFQSDLTSRKVIKSIEEKVRQGGWPSKAPPGYRNSTKGGKKVVEVDPSYTSVIKDVFRLYSTKQYSLAELSDRLYEAGIRTKAGNRLHASRIHHMLRNPFYVGRIRWGKLEARGAHQPLVDRRLFERVGRLLSQRAQTQSRRRIHDFLLRGMLRCGCGRLLVGEVHVRKRQYRYYRCHNGHCSNNVRMEQVDEEVADLVESLYFSDRLLKVVEKQVQEELRQKGTVHQKKIDAANREKARIAGMEKQLDSQFLRQTINPQEYRRMQDKLAKEKEAVEGTLSKAGLFAANANRLVESLSELLRNLGKAYKEASPNHKRLYLGLFWKDFVISDGVLHPVRTKLYEALGQSQDLYLDLRGDESLGWNLPPPSSKDGDIPDSPSRFREAEPNEPYSKHRLTLYLLNEKLSSDLETNLELLGFSTGTGEGREV